MTTRNLEDETRDSRFVRVPLTMMDSQPGPAPADVLDPVQRYHLDAAVKRIQYRQLSEQHGGNRTGYATADADRSKATEAYTARNERLADAWKGDAQPAADNQADAAKRGEDAAARAADARDARIRDAWKGTAA